jgi:hypothetical protein
MAEFIRPPWGRNGFSGQNEKNRGIADGNRNGMDGCQDGGDAEMRKDTPIRYPFG